MSEERSIADGAGCMPLGSHLEHGQQLFQERNRLSRPLCHQLDSSTCEFGEGQEPIDLAGMLLQQIVKKLRDTTASMQFSLKYRIEFRSLDEHM